MQQSSATQSLHLSFRGLRKIVACSHSSSQCLLVSTVFGMVSSLHPTFFNDFYTCILLYKCKIRCRDDTVPKTVDTRKHCKVWLRACNNLPQPQYCCMLSTLPCSAFLYLQFLAQCHPYIFLLMIFTLVSLKFSSHRHGNRHPSLNCMRMRMWYVQWKL